MIRRARRNIWFPVVAINFFRWLGLRSRFHHTRIPQVSASPEMIDCIRRSRRFTSHQSRLANARVAVYLASLMPKSPHSLDITWQQPPANGVNVTESNPRSPIGPTRPSSPKCPGTRTRALFGDARPSVEFDASREHLRDAIAEASTAQSLCVAASPSTDRA